METVQERGVDSLASLEDRITRAVHLIAELRAQNGALTKRVTALEEEIKGGTNSQRDLEAANADLLKERKEVRIRIEKLLSQLDLLSAS